MKYIPKKLTIGFRQETAFVTYRDKENNIKKPVAFENWCDSKIPLLECDNNPISGFKLIGRSGGGSGDIRMAWIVLEDYRKFTIEIELSDFLEILESCDIINGVIQGEFVYGFDNTRMILINVNSDEYKDIVASTEQFDNPALVDLKGKDLIPGHVYFDKNNDGYKFLLKTDNGYVFRDMRFIDNENTYISLSTMKTFKKFIYKKDEVFTESDLNIIKYLNHNIHFFNIAKKIETKEILIDSKEGIKFLQMGSNCNGDVDNIVVKKNSVVFKKKLFVSDWRGKASIKPKIEDNYHVTFRLLTNGYYGICDQSYPDMKDIKVCLDFIDKYLKN